MVALAALRDGRAQIPDWWFDPPAQTVPPGRAARTARGIVGRVQSGPFPAPGRRRVWSARRLAGNLASLGGGLALSAAGVAAVLAAPHVGRMAIALPLAGAGVAAVLGGRWVR